MIVTEGGLFGGLLDSASESRLSSSHLSYFSDILEVCCGSSIREPFLHSTSICLQGSGDTIRRGRFAYLESLAFDFGLSLRRIFGFGKDDRILVISMLKKLSIHLDWENHAAAVKLLDDVVAQSLILLSLPLFGRRTWTYLNIALSLLLF